MKISDAWRVLQAAEPALPRENDLSQEIADAIAAQERGYYLPDEDERLREVYARYLAVRGTLWEMVLALKPHVYGGPDEKEQRQVFGLSFCAAAMLVRCGSFIVNLAHARPVLWKKLDEAEPRYGLERKNFTRLYRSTSSLRWMWVYTEAIRYYESNREEIQEALISGGMASAAEWLSAEEPFFEKNRSSLIRRRLSYRLHSIVRRHTSGYKKVMFQIFRMGGSVIAELKQPFKKQVLRKRVTSEVLAEVKRHLRAGDVIVTRHEDALSNLFLPGYWPHAAYYIGDAIERDHLGIEPTDANNGRISVLEAKKDGVLYRTLEETLAVDAFVVIRPRIKDAHLREALSRAMTHEGKLYDFVFDFRNADRLVCTEVIYRAYHGVGNFSFALSHRSGRHCLSAEDILNQGIGAALFEVVLCFGVEDEELRWGDSAQSRVLASLRKFGA
ncbi:MAG: YiiX/YebB-like N1pC/P60 family cysteine hydrolase [Akkermansiaceae bacterium]